MKGDTTEERLDKREGAIEGMFNGIAHKYDLLNHLLSLNIDTLWRKEVVEFLKESSRGKEPLKVLDIACGTGDSTIALYKSGFDVTGVDIAEKMLEVARQKNKRLKKGGEGPLPNYLTASAEQLPFADERFDAVTICFGIRNFNNRGKCLAEILRVMQSEGVIAILEFAQPKNRVIKPLYNLYLKKILPFVGGVVSKNKKAYKYLAESIEQFPKYEAFCQELHRAGYREIQYKALSGGIALLYTAKKGKNVAR